MYLPGTHKFITLGHSSPAMDSLERPEVQGKTFRAIRPPLSTSRGTHHEEIRSPQKFHRDMGPVEAPLTSNHDISYVVILDNRKLLTILNLDGLRSNGKYPIKHIISLQMY